MSTDGNQERADAQSQMDALKREYERLRQQQIRAEADRENAEQRLAELEQDAKESYGTADPDELQSMLETIEAENERLTAEYRKHLQSVETAVQAVESRVREEGPRES